jgi:hypothetical protein
MAAKRFRPPPRIVDIQPSRTKYPIGGEAIFTPQACAVPRLVGEGGTAARTGRGVSKRILVGWKLA